MSCRPGKRWAAEEGTEYSVLSTQSSLRHSHPESRTPYSVLRTPYSVLSLRYTTRTPRPSLLTLALCLVLATPAFAQPTPEPFRLPAVGRPADFSGAVGQSFKVTMKADPTTLQAEDPLTLTLTITAAGRVMEPPHRPDLNALAEFHDDFIIRDLPDAAAPGPPWTYRYELRPRTAVVNRVPAFRLSYYNPQIGRSLPERGWQAQFASAINLKVRPRPAVGAGAVEGRQDVFNADDPIYHLAEGPDVLRRDDYAGLPSPFVLALLLGLPPAACLGWLLLWRRWYPDEAEQARRRRSRAARLALRALRGVPEESHQTTGQRAAVIVAGYLRQRLDLQTTEPTPMETTAFLQRAGCSGPVAVQAAEFLRLCDAARFAPHPPGKGNEVLPAARQLILALEAESWSS